MCLTFFLSSVFVNVHIQYPHKFPIVPGWEFAGVVTKVVSVFHFLLTPFSELQGLGAEKFAVGDEVYSYCRRSSVGLYYGTYCEYITVPVGYVAKCSKSISLAEASAVSLSSLTAYQGLFDVLGAKKGEVVLINGASGGVGSFVVQFMKIKGLTSICIASKKNHAYLKSLGASYVIDYNIDTVKAIGDLGLKIDHLFDCYCKEGSTAKYIRLLRKGGHALHLLPGYETGEAEKKRGVTASHMFCQPGAKTLEMFNEWFDSKQLRVNIHKVWKFDDHLVDESDAEMMGGHTRGKMTLSIY